MNEEIIDKIVLEVKSQGLFDEFRKQSMADVDTKPAYQNLKQRVENTVQSFLNLQKWTPNLNRNQLREKLRKNIIDAGYLETGVERIVDQVVSPNVIASVFNPQIEDLVYKYLGIEKPKMIEPNPYEELKTDLEIKTDDLSNDLDELSPYSDKCENMAGTSGQEHHSFEAGELVDDEEESPPFEPIAEVVDMDLEDPKSLDSQISGLTSQDSVESECEKPKTEPKPESPPEIKEPPNDLRPEDINYSVDSQQQENDTQLSQVSSNESRLSIITDGDQASTSPRLDITEEAQMPSFNENSDSFEKDEKAKPTTCNFDLNAGEKYEFKGTERKPVLTLTENSNLENTNTFFSEEKSETDVKTEGNESPPKPESTDESKTLEIEAKADVVDNGAPQPAPADTEQAFKDEILEALEKDEAVVKVEQNAEKVSEVNETKKDSGDLKKNDSSSSRSHKHSSKSSSSSDRKRDRDRKSDHRNRDRSRDHHKSSSRDRDKSKTSSSSSRHKSSRSSSSSSKHSKYRSHERHRSKSSSSSEKSGKKKEEKVSDDHSQSHNKPNPSDSNDGGGGGEGGHSAKSTGGTESCAKNAASTTTTSTATSADSGTTNSSTNVAATEQKMSNEVFLAPMPPPKLEEPGSVVSLSTPPVVIDVEFFTAQNQLSTDDVLDSIPTHIIYPSIAHPQQHGGEAKVKKPRFASNFSEARKLHKIRKKIGMQEQKRKDAILKQYLSVHPESKLAQQSQGLELEFACQPIDGQAGPIVSSPQKGIVPSRSSPEPPVVVPESSAPVVPVNINNNNEEKKEVEVAATPVDEEPEFFGFPLTDEVFAVDLAAMEFLKKYAVHPPFQKPVSQDTAFKIPHKRVRKPNNRFSSANFELENFDDVELYNGVVEHKPATDTPKRVVEKPIEAVAEQAAGDIEVAKATPIPPVGATKRRHSSNRLQQCYSNDDLYKPRLSIGKRRRGVADSPPVDGKI